MSGRTTRWLPLLLALGLAACERPQPQSVFVSLPVQDSVLKLDARTGEVLARTKVGRLPHHLLVDAPRRRVYVVLTGSQAVAELDLDSGALRRTFLTEPVPERRPDGSRIDGHFSGNAFRHTSCYACHRGGEGGVKPVIVGNRPFAIAFTPDRDALLVTNTRGGSIARIDLHSGRVEPLPIAPAGAAVEPTSLALRGNRMFTTVLAPQPADDPAVLREVDLETGALVREIVTGPRANFVLADPRRDEVYVANFETNTISVIGAGEPERIAVGPGPQGMALSADGERLIVANYYGNSMSIVRLADRHVDTFPLVLGDQRYSNPSHLVLTGDGRAWVVTSGTQGYLLQVDLEARAVVSAAAVGPLPFDLAAAGGRP